LLNQHMEATLGFCCRRQQRCCKRSGGPQWRTCICRNSFAMH